MHTVTTGLKNLTIFDPNRVFHLVNKSAREVSDSLRKTIPAMIKTINREAESSGKAAAILTFVYYVGYGILDD